MPTKEAVRPQNGNPACMALCLGTAAVRNKGQPMAPSSRDGRKKRSRAVGDMGMGYACYTLPRRASFYFPASGAAAPLVWLNQLLLFRGEGDTGSLDAAQAVGKLESGNLAVAVASPSRRPSSP